MITADTITDAQILKLHEELRYEIEGALAQMSHIERALGRGVFTDHLVKLSRARCAEILNARGGK